MAVAFTSTALFFCPRREWVDAIRKKNSKHHSLLPEKGFLIFIIF
jgi:hypothetical protein